MRVIILIFLSELSLAAEPFFQIRLSPAARSSPVDGRLIVVVSKKLEGEPRFQVSWGLEAQQIFGMDVDGWKPGDAVEMQGKTMGAPVHTLADLPPGKYNVQAVLNVGETFRRADGRVLKLHPDHGEGQRWNASPGNLYSKAQQVQVQASSVTRLELTEMIPPIDPPKDTKYIRHLRIESKLLTEFWGRPVFLSASVLVPRDFDDSKQHYPVAFQQDHFTSDFRGFRETPPAGNARVDAFFTANSDAVYAILPRRPSGEVVLDGLEDAGRVRVTLLEGGQPLDSTMQGKQLRVRVPAAVAAGLPARQAYVLKLAGAK